MFFYHCPHLHTRCLHGDEINRYHYRRLRFGLPALIYVSWFVARQLCLDCGAALDRIAICTATGEDLHNWEGPWPYDNKSEEK